jgi:organic radical activating enzyme
MSNVEQKAMIKEIFASIQGEGLLVGVQQIFIRFCKCNLSCKYCDTDFSSDYREFTSNELVDYLHKNFDLRTINSISLTGGEPLLWSEFLKDFLPLVNLPIYLETNGTLYEKLDLVFDNIDYISADIKLPSCAGVKDSFDKHFLFFDRISTLNKSIDNSKKFCYANGNIFAKVVFDENITEEEIIKSTELAKKYHFEIILQPKMNKTGMSISSNFIEKVFRKFLDRYNKTRVIPQVHKFLDVE